MKQHQPYAMDDWNFPRRPVSLHPEAALNEDDTQESPGMDMMLSQINDGDSVTAHYLAGNQDEVGFGWLGAGRLVNVGSMKDQRVQEIDIDFGGMDWEGWAVGEDEEQQEDAVEAPQDQEMEIELEAMELKAEPIEVGSRAKMSLLELEHRMRKCGSTAQIFWHAQK